MHEKKIIFRANFEMKKKEGYTLPGHLLFMPVKFYQNRFSGFEDYPEQTDRQTFFNRCLCFHSIMVIV